MEGRYKVLVIDDSPFIFKAVKRAVESEGFQVVGNAPNGKIGLELAEKYHPDIITLDVTMPVMDGLETAKALFEKDANTKIIMLSAMGDEGLINQARDIGVKYFLTKPFKKPELMEMMRDILKGV